jgi:hypothetical protein
MKTNYKLLSFLLATFIVNCSPAQASKFDLLFGAFSYDAKVGSKSTKVSGLGTYEIAYLLPFKDHFEINLGYSFTMTSIISGDYSYGPKLGVNYFPFNFSSNEKIILPNKVVEVHDYMKPYVGISFNQRQFQSAKSSYAGFGLSLGVEKFINPKYTLKFELKLNNYTGAAEATASEKNILTGLVISF